jgi:peptidoglycan/LPS O-acetylase OafA/YrhL
MNSFHPKYRADIDGLRAFAVIAVVIYHVFPGMLPGGFTGVDIFFVISGYLITSIIYQNIKNQNFSFFDFYNRRILRIFPALLLMITACLIFGWFSLSSDEYSQLGKHSIFGVGFLSNIVLLNESGYFDKAAELKPLMHLWSLGVEEQFYIIWPIIFLIGVKLRIKIKYVLIGVLISSFILNIVILEKNVTADFYLPFTRFWELAMGGYLAILLRNRSTGDPKLLAQNILSVFGMILIIFSVLFINNYLDYPGWWAIFPVAGSSILIAFCKDSFLNKRILGCKLIASIGLISYPLYLWHWPLISFLLITKGNNPSLFERGCVIAASFLMAFLTYQFLEKNIRILRGGKATIYLIIWSMSLALCGTLIWFNSGFPSRLISQDFLYQGNIIVENIKQETKNANLESSAALNLAISQENLSKNIDHGKKATYLLTNEVAKQLAGPEWEYTKNAECLDSNPTLDIKKSIFCIKSSPRNPTVIFLGTSFANQYYPGFVANKAFNKNTFLSLGICDFSGTPHPDPKNVCHNPADAVDWINLTNDVVKSHPSIKYAIVAGLLGRLDETYVASLNQRIVFFQDHGIQVIVITPHLFPDFEPNQCFDQPSLARERRDCTFTEQKKIEAYEAFKPFMNEIIKRNPKVLFFDPNEFFCENGECSFISDGLPLVRDARHLSEHGSAKVQKSFMLWAKKNIPGIFNVK